MIKGLTNNDLPLAATKSFRSLINNSIKLRGYSSRYFSSAITSSNFLRNNFFSTPNNPANNTSVLTNIINNSNNHNQSNNGLNNSSFNLTASGLIAPSYACNKTAVAKLFKQHASGSKERAFFINDIGMVERQFNRWTRELPQVMPLYAIKCNPDETLLKGKTNHFYR
jgi:hypothetical protein